MIWWRPTVVAMVAALVLSAAALAFGASRGIQAPASSKRPAADSFTTLAARADRARQDARLDEALDLYRRALKMRPAWTEGWWHVGTLEYELDRFEPARDAFNRVLQNQAAHAGARGLKGLCEYRLKNYDVALSDLLQARSMGLGANPSIVDVVRYHAAILASRAGHFEHALQILHEFVRAGDDAPRVIEATGIATLRIASLPEELPPNRREAVMIAGRAGYLMAGRQMAAAENAFDTLVTRFPDTPNVHYAQGVFLLNEHPDAALEAFKRELAKSPDHLWSRLQIAFEYVRRGEFQTARPWAEQARTQAPDQFVARKVMGQVLLELGDTGGAIQELEAGVKLAPDSPALRFTLATAYRRAGRTADADREQAEFTRLDRILRATRSGSQALGGIDVDTPGVPRK